MVSELYILSQLVTSCNNKRNGGYSGRTRNMDVTLLSQKFVYPMVADEYRLRSARTARGYKDKNQCCKNMLEIVCETSA